MAITLSLISMSASCLGPTPLEIELQRELHQTRLALAEKEKAIAERDAKIAALERQVEKTRPFQGVSIDKIVTVDRIQIVSRSGGEDFDGKPGDDGVVVYVRPVDSNGDVIKASGSFTVQLVDLATPGEPRSLGEYTFDDPDQLAKAWYGGFLTNHYTLRCKFREGAAPSTRELLARVTFVDFLTGHVHSASQSLTIKRIDH